MGLKIRLLVFASALLTLISYGNVKASQITDSTGSSCKVTLPNGQGTFHERPSVGLYGNGVLSVAPWPDGTVVVVKIGTGPTTLGDPVPELCGTSVNCSLKTPRAR